MRIVARNIRPAQRHHHRGAPQVEERQQRAGRQREEDVERVVAVGAHQPANQRQGRDQIAGRVGHTRLVDPGAPASDSIHREQLLLLGALSGSATLCTGGDHVYLDPAFNQSLRQGSGRDRSAAAEWWILVVQDQDPHRDCSNRSRRSVPSSLRFRQRPCIRLCRGGSRFGGCEGKR